MKIRKIIFALPLICLLAYPSSIASADPSQRDAGALMDAGTPERDAGVSIDAGVSTVVAPLEKSEKIETTEEASDAVNFLLEASRNGQWALFVGILGMLLVWLLDRVIQIKDKVSKKTIPWVAAGLGLIASFSMWLVGDIPLGSALMQGLLGGTTAVGMWEMLFQHLLKRKSNG